MLIRLRGCAGWSAFLFFANPRRHVSFVAALILLCAHITYLEKYCFFYISCSEDIEKALMEYPEIDNALKYEEMTR